MIVTPDTLTRYRRAIVAEVANDMSRKNVGDAKAVDNNREKHHEQKRVKAS